MIYCLKQEEYGKLKGEKLIPTCYNIANSINILNLELCSCKFEELDLGSMTINLCNQSMFRGTFEASDMLPQLRLG